VLLPLRDVAPGWVHPQLGMGIGSLIAALPPQDIRPVAGND
jgi:2-amino-4-hydroxy-6-hydroxymethyldihydropteridine diphosphokinase